MGNNLVSVKIYGQEYNISGDKSREQIIKIADYVDRNMYAMAEVAKNAPVSALAVLSSINIADEYFDTLARLDTQEQISAQKDKDIEHYVDLWNEAKKSFAQFKEETRDIIMQRDNLKKTISDRDEEIKELRKMCEESEKRAQAGDAEKLEAVEEREKELESSFFDLQMENIKLKSELESIKKNQDDFDGRL